MSSISTKFGDNGMTRLYSNETISKRSVRIQACGDIDELVCQLGLAYQEFLDKDIKGYNFIPEELINIQRKLFIVASEIATNEPKLSKLPNRIDQKEMDLLDEKRNWVEEQFDLPKGFILPGTTNMVAAHLDVCRAVSRRCERVIVALYNDSIIDNKILLMWMNRLSDYLYLLARYTEDENYSMVK